MIRMRVQLSDDLRVEFDELRSLGRDADKAVKADLDRIAKTIQPALKRDLVALTPGPVRLPIQWTSEKQRRAFFATKGFGKGIPYRRRQGNNSLLGQWRVRKYVSQGGNLLTATNESEVYQYVIETPERPGAWQRFHRNTGWPNSGQVDAVFDRYADMAEALLIEGWLGYMGV